MQSINNNVKNLRKKTKTSVGSGSCPPKRKQFAKPLHTLKITKTYSNNQSQKLSLSGHHREGNLCIGNVLFTKQVVRTQHNSKQGFQNNLSLAVQLLKSRQPASFRFTKTFAKFSANERFVMKRCTSFKPLSAISINRDWRS